MIRLSKRLAQAAIILFAATGTAQALEGTAPAGPIGGTDLNQALLPQPGLYPFLVGGGVDLSRYRLGGGDDVRGDGHVGFGAVGALFVYPQTLFGGQLASSFGAGKQRVCYSAGPAPESCSEGAMDIYTDLLLWSKFSPSKAFADQPRDRAFPIPYGTAFMLGLGVTWPTGEYSSSDPVNVGSNFFTISPTMAVTHTAPSIFGAGPGRATQVSARLFYNHYTENGDTDYNTGNTVSLDFSASEIVGPWQFGVAGTGWTQIADDKIDGNSNGLRGSAMNLGLIAQYSFTVANRPAFIKAKYLWMVEGEYIPQSEGLTVSMGFKF
ncbi:SphA family protein [Salipiger abyssi]|uniref:Transporter n=1 Tax=Salipiger abyssi TaxID=1250539 RepID=A0A1P8UN47_9RHOB|nr:transporter [Salipiger abyssi]APZ50803.1 hypothetical protein Ga0080574_TMP469 [Salipiger abyssi]